MSLSRVVLFCLVLLSVLSVKVGAQTIVYPKLVLTVTHNSSFWDDWDFVMKPGTREISGDNGDLTKISNAQFNIYSLSSNNVALNVDARDADSMADGDVVRLGITSVPLYTYTITVTQDSLPTDKAVYLHDKYTGTYLLLGNGVTYTFSVNSDTGSHGNFRMELIFNDTRFYSAAIGNINNTATFGRHTDGSGTHPNNFTGNSKTYHLINNNTGVLSADWTVSGTGSKIVADTSFAITGHSVNAKIMVTAGKAISVASGSTLTTNDSLVLMSGARIGTMNGTITGKVVIETQLNAQRGYRLLGLPYTSSQNIATLGSFFDITGLTTGNIGPCTSNNPSIYNYTPGTTPAYIGVTAIGSNTFPSASSGSTHSNGILVFVRGATGQGCSGGIYTPSTISMVTTGVINTGGVTETVPAGGWNLICNPLPSQITISSIINYDSLDAFEIVNPAGQNGGVLSTNGSQYISVSSSTVIPVNGAFLAHNPTASDITLTFPESAKTASTPVNNLFKVTNNASTLELTTFFENNIWDTWRLQFKTGASAKAGDNGDLDKISNAQFDLYSMSADNVLLNVDARDGDSIADGGVVLLGIRSVQPLSYNLVVTGYSLPNNKIVYLHDKYANAYVLLGNGVNYPFTVNADTASQGRYRMELVFNDINNMGITGIANCADVSLVPNPATTRISIHFGNVGMKEIRILNTLGQIVKVLSTSETSLTIPIGDLTNGMYLLKTVMNNKITTTRFVKH
ncbi:MAG: T9SS type A sorting domain-containing protein [Flavipsychrobacter sp.]|nr:T9SS type A sorting domain-containing protein [Flavipsychrobacter sp.]